MVEVCHAIALLHNLLLACATLFYAYRKLCKYLYTNLKNYII